MSLIEGSLKDRLKEALDNVLSEYDIASGEYDGLVAALVDEAYAVFTDEEGIEDTIFEVPSGERDEEPTR